MTITVFTPTCDRPEAFRLCETFLNRQTRQPDQWIIVDDSEVPAFVTPACKVNFQYFHRPEFRGKGSMVKKLRMILEAGLVTSDILVFIEDDDWYDPTYLEWVEKAMHGQVLIGEGRNLYYNVQHRWWFDHGNLQHASLCATAVHRSAFPQLSREAQNTEDPFIDSRLWKSVRGRKMVFDPHKLGRRLSVGIKAMPGVKGYGSGHDRDAGWAIKDPTMVKLRELIGEDAQHYENYYTGPIHRVVAQNPEMPKIEVHIVAYNEEFIIPYAIRHYKTFASRIIVHDGGSTDRTKAICEEMGAEVHHWETGGQINDELLRVLKETCWNGTSADWVIMVDADELVVFPDGVSASMKSYEVQSLAVVKTKGFEMESPTLPTTNGQIYEEIDHGTQDERWYSKPIILRPSLIQSIHFTHGAHECIVTLKSGRRLQNPRAYPTRTPYLLHYKHIGTVERLAAIYDAHKSRFSDINRTNGWGWQGEGLQNATRKREAIMRGRRKVL